MQAPGKQSDVPQIDFVCAARALLSVLERALMSVLEVVEDWRAMVLAGPLSVSKHH